MKPKMLIFGHGYVGKFLLEYFTKLGWNVCITSRHKSGDNIIEYNKSSIENALKDVTHIITTIPPNENGDVVLVDFLNLIECTTNLEWIGYISSTAVYGDYEGHTVYEDSLLKCVSTRGMQRVVAEEQWRKLCEDRTDLSIFRLAGIYGPGRSAIDNIKAGTARSIYKEGQVFSRIHIQDIEHIIHSAITANKKFEIYNVADDYPCATSEVNQFAADLLGVTAPTLEKYEEANLSVMAAEFYQDNRRVCNDKIKKTLGIKLLYPSFREGLNAIYRDLIQGQINLKKSI
ncbi:MAG: SDR family NAD(P)-dependent oxidoreductase [Rickettsiales bacterium]|nr:SDR family NAD(P)-dependent oxidoreductase [Rickettsiales bacterium]MCA0254490.1 SDR family NAD(P)-dependent oxidoreductase [Pseudomonadota bacterium]